MLSVRLDDETETYLRGLAAQEDRTVNAMLGRIVREHARFHPLESTAPTIHLERLDSGGVFVLKLGDVRVGTLELDCFGNYGFKIDTTKLIKELP